MSNFVAMLKETRGRGRLYQFEDFEVGEIREYPIAKKFTIRTSLAYYCRQYHPDWKFQSRTEDKKLKVQRIK